MSDDGLWTEVEHIELTIPYREPSIKLIPISRALTWVPCDKEGFFQGECRVILIEADKNILSVVPCVTLPVTSSTNIRINYDLRKGALVCCWLIYISGTLLYNH